MERGSIFFSRLIRVKNACGVCPETGIQASVVVAGLGEMSAVRWELEEDVAPH